MIIRICTEDKNSERVRELCAKRFDAFTIYRGMGAWKRKLEPSMTIEIAVLGDNALDRAINEKNTKTEALKLSQDIKQLNNQEAVLIEFIESQNVLI
jgi:hypothetical protein